MSYNNEYFDEKIAARIVGALRTELANNGFNMVENQLKRHWFYLTDINGTIMDDYEIFNKELFGTYALVIYEKSTRVSVQFIVGDIAKGFDGSRLSLAGFCKEFMERMPKSITMREREELERLIGDKWSMSGAGRRSNRL